MYPVRVSVKGILIKDRKILLTQHRHLQTFFTLPGGGQNGNEPLKTALQRECLEETGARVEVGDLLLVRDYIADNHNFASVSPGFHQIELMFSCTLISDSMAAPSELDDYQIGAEWHPLDTLHKLPLYPAILSSIIPNLDQYKGPVYLGDIN